MSSSKASVEKHGPNGAMEDVLGILAGGEGPHMTVKKKLVQARLLLPVLNKDLTLIGQKIISSSKILWQYLV